MIIYIVAISFQLTGAVFLISNFWPNKISVVNDMAEYEANMHWGEMNDGKCTSTYSAEELNKQAEKNYRIFLLCY